MPNIIKDQDGTHPLVFKRIDASETKIRPVEVNKRFFLTSGSEINAGNPFDKEPDFMALFANYEPGLISIDPNTGKAFRFYQPEVQVLDLRSHEKHLGSPDPEVVPHLTKAIVHM